MSTQLIRLHERSFQRRRHRTAKDRKFEQRPCEGYPTGEAYRIADGTA